MRSSRVGRRSRWSTNSRTPTVSAAAIPNASIRCAMSPGGRSVQEVCDLLATVIDESERLNRFIAYLLDITKLELGAVVPNRAQRDIRAIVSTSLRRPNKSLVRHKVPFERVADLPLLELDAVLFEQMLSNLLDSAAKYAAGMDSAFPWSKIMPLCVDQNVRSRPPLERSGTPSGLLVRTIKSEVLGRRDRFFSAPVLLGLRPPLWETESQFVTLIPMGKGSGVLANHRRRGEHSTARAGERI
jgi:hypothetical protein